MKLSVFLKKNRVSNFETELALKAYGDNDMDEKIWTEKLKKSVKLNPEPKAKEIVKPENKQTTEKNK